MIQRLYVDILHDAITHPYAHQWPSEVGDCSNGCVCIIYSILTVFDIIYV